MPAPSRQLVPASSRHVRRPARGMAVTGLAAVCLAVSLPGCKSANTSALPSEHAQTSTIETACARLVAAEPAGWPTAATAVFRDAETHRPQVTQALIDALDTSPAAPGRQIGIAVLGALSRQDERAQNWLRQTLAARDEHAAEAALALGRSASTSHIPALLAVVDDRIASPTLRAACAASLLRLGERQTVRKFVAALLLADTPTGHALQAEVGLASSSRWAHDRYLLIAAIDECSGQDFELDTDAPWPQLQQAVGRVTQWLEAP